MTPEEARRTAAARGFASVREWMKANRKAAGRHRSAAASDGRRKEECVIVKKT